MAFDLGYDFKMGEKSPRMLYYIGSCSRGTSPWTSKCTNHTSDGRFIGHLPTYFAIAIPRRNYVFESRKSERSFYRYNTLSWLVYPNAVLTPGPLGADDQKVAFKLRICHAAKNKKSKEK